MFEVFTAIGIGSAFLFLLCGGLSWGLDEPLSGVERPRKLHVKKAKKRKKAKKSKRARFHLNSFKVMERGKPTICWTTGRPAGECRCTNCK